MEFSGNGVDESIQKGFLRIIGIDGVRVFDESDTGRKLRVVKADVGPVTDWAWAK